MPQEEESQNLLEVKKNVTLIEKTSGLFKRVRGSKLQGRQNPGKVHVPAN